MHHPIFDIQYWKKQFPDDDDLSIDDFNPRKLRILQNDSPISILQMEKYRKLAIDHGYDLGLTVPVDLFVLGWGEAPQRHLTKIHGLPYRPIDQPWPLDEFGEPLIFLAQFSFVDSIDHIGPLPGDILLVFIADMYKIGYLKFVFEWQKLGIADLITTCPPSTIKIPVCYGVRYRSVDFLDTDIAPNVYKSIFKVSPNLKINPGGYNIDLRSITCAFKLKIGGVPFWYDFHRLEKEPKVNGRFICSFYCVNPSMHIKYPFVNEEEPIHSFEQLCDEGKFFIFYDGAVFNFYLMDDGAVLAFSQYS